MKKEQNTTVSVGYWMFALLISWLPLINLICVPCLAVIGRNETKKKLLQSDDCMGLTSHRSSPMPHSSFRMASDSWFHKGLLELKLIGIETERSTPHENPQNQNKTELIIRAAGPHMSPPRCRR